MGSRVEMSAAGVWLFCVQNVSSCCRSTYHAALSFRCGLMCVSSSAPGAETQDWTLFTPAVTARPGAGH